MDGIASIFVYKDKLCVFINITDLWISKVEVNNNSTFQTLKSLTDNEKYADLTI